MPTFALAVLGLLIDLPGISHLTSLTTCCQASRFGMNVGLGSKSLPSQCEAFPAQQRRLAAKWQSASVRELFWNKPT